MFSNGFVSYKVRNRYICYDYQENTKIFITDAVGRHMLETNTGVAELRGRLLGEQSKLPNYYSLGIWTHLNSICNFSCQYCSVRKDISEPLDLNHYLAVVQKLFDARKTTGIQRLEIIFAGGEPLLQFSSMVAIYNRLSAISKDFFVYHIVTNGSVISNEVVAFIKENKIQVAISLDGVGSTHDKTRQYKDKSGTFYDISKNIDLLVSHDIYPILYCVVNDNNYRELISIYRYASEHKLILRLSFVRKSYTNSFTRMAANLRYAYGIVALIRYITRNPSYRNLSKSLILANLDFSGNGHRISHCGITKNYLAIKGKGECYTCMQGIDVQDFAVCVEDNGKINLCNETLHTELDTSITAKCLRCTWRHICRGGCPVSKFGNYGTFNHESEYCLLYKIIVPRFIKTIGHSILKNS